MGFFLKLLGKRYYGDKYCGSNYYKREGFLSCIFKMFGLFFSLGRWYNKYNLYYFYYN